MNKFRAYHKEHNFFGVVRFIDFVYGIVQFSTKHSLVSDSLDKVKLMQSTGLRDKNGDEIYEGDIVRIVQNGVGVLGEIKKDSFMWYVFDFAYKFEGSLYDIYRTCELEVVGNIYESPELVEADEDE